MHQWGLVAAAFRLRLFVSAIEPPPTLCLIHFSGLDGLRVRFRPAGGTLWVHNLRSRVFSICCIWSGYTSAFFAYPAQSETVDMIRSMISSDFLIFIFRATSSRSLRLRPSRFPFRLI